MKQKSLKDDIIKYVYAKYNTKPEYLWKSYPDYFVLRHRENQKWYALVMNVSSDKLGIPEKRRVDILNLKLDPVMQGSLRMNKGFYPSYHMRSDSWITILLDGTVESEDILPLIDISYSLTLQNKSTRKTKRIKNWLFPANPKYYDIETEIKKNPADFLWKQSGNISVGNTVYLYITAPVSELRYKFVVTETDIPYNHKNEYINIKKVMRLRLVSVYDRVPIGRSVLNEHGIRTVRGARSMPESLIEEINSIYNE